MYPSSEKIHYVVKEKLLGRETLILNRMQLTQTYVLVHQVVPQYLLKTTSYPIK